MQSKLCPYNKCSSKWGTRKPQHQSKQTSPWCFAWWHTRSSQRPQKQCTWAFNGSAMVSNCKNFATTGIQEQQILPIIKPSITQQRITNKCKKFSNHPVNQHGKVMEKAYLNWTQTTTQIQHSTSWTTEQTMASATVMHPSSCEAVLKSQNSLAPTGDGKMGQKIPTPIRGQR